MTRHSKTLEGIFEWSMLGASCALLSLSVFYMPRKRGIHADADEVCRTSASVSSSNVPIDRVRRGDSQGEKLNKKDDSLSRVEEFTQVRLLACIY